MYKREFRKLINECEELLLNDYEAYGVCDVLRIVFKPYDLEFYIVSMFSAILHPPIAHGPYWLGVRNKENLTTRLFFLRMFEYIYIDEKKHLSFF